MYQITTLDNGLRILSAPMPYAHSVSVAFFLAAGSRYENPEESGLSHFVEHLCFKGTRQRPSAKDISEAIERVGGVLNGGTDKEITVYWCKVARPHFELGVDILSDMLRNSLFDVSEIDKERNVINEEISMSWDSPGHRTELLLDEVLWPGNALGRDVAGSRETLPNINKDLLVDYVTRQYLPNTMVVGVAGAIEHQEVVSVIDRYLRDWEKGSPRLLHPAADTQEEPRLKVEYKDTEQAHLCLAVRGIPLLHPDRYALDLLNVILGEGMSSRLFQEIREKHCLAYDIHSYVNYFRDAGSLVIGAGVDPKQLSRTISAILEQLRLIKKGITRDELQKVKDMTKGRLLLRLEDSRSVAGFLAAQELLTNRVLVIEEVVAAIDSVKEEDILKQADNLLVSSRLNMAVVGPLKNGGDLKDLLFL